MFQVKKLLVLLVILASTALFNGCAAGPGKRMVTTMPNGEKTITVTHKPPAPLWMLSSRKLSLNYLVPGNEITDTQLAVVETVEEAGRIYIQRTQPNDLLSVSASGVLFFAAGYAGGYFGSQAFSGANPRQYGLYMGTATGLVGLANGLVYLGTKSYNFQIYGMQVLDGSFPGYGIKVIIKSP